MNSFLPIATLAFCSVLLSLSTGCQSVQPKIGTSETVTEVAATPVVRSDELVAWLAEAPQPAVVTCSVERETAPDAVDRFNALSERIGGLYATVYQEAQSAAAATAVGDMALDDVLSKVAAQMTGPEGASTDWKTTAQAAVIANYQATMKEIDTCGKQLTDYTESLREDSSISNLTSRLEQSQSKVKVLFQLGKDSTELGRQLKETCDGVSAIRSRRMATALGK